jgi:RNA polymerase sigma factor (sigma-70 family)
LPPQYIDIHKAIVDRCRNGDGRAQHELYHLYAKAMYNVIMRIVNHREEAQDVLQEAFVEAFGRISEFKGETTFGAWIKKIMVNRSINCLRRRRLLLFEVLPDSEFYEEYDYSYADDRWEVAQISKVIQGLPDGYRLVLTLYLLEGYDHEEIAGILHISEATSRSQYYRAKAKVREQLTKAKKTNYAG